MSAPLDTTEKFRHYAHPEALVSTQWVAEHAGDWRERRRFRQRQAELDSLVNDWKAHRERDDRHDG